VSVLSKFFTFPEVREVPTGESMLIKQTGVLDPRESTDSTHTDRIPDLAQLRRWALIHPIVFAGLRLLTNPVVGQPWTVRPKHPQRATADTLARANMAEYVLAHPNPSPHGMNQSFRSLLRVGLWDVEIGDVGCLLPQRDGHGRIRCLHNVNPASVEFRRHWRSDNDGPRYKLYHEDGKRWRWLMNDELITLANNPISWDERGIPPLRVLHDTLEADLQVFLAQWQKQLREAPTGILNMPRAQKRIVDAVEMYYRSRIEGKATIGVANLPADTTFIRIGNANVGSEWVHFTDTVVRRVAVALDLTPVDLGWTQLTHQATAEFESEKSAEKAIKPRSEMVAEILNTEFLPTWGDDLEFAWTGLGGKEETRMASVIQTLGSTGAWGYNELRAMRGDPILHYDDPVEQALADDPIFANREQPPIPLRLYAAQLRATYPDATAQLDGTIEGPAAAHLGIPVRPNAAKAPQAPPTPVTPVQVVGQTRVIGGANQRAIPATLARSMSAADEADVQTEIDRYATTIDLLTSDHWRTP
jgi:hypothetical protein